MDTLSYTRTCSYEKVDNNPMDTKQCHCKTENVKTKHVLVCNHLFLYYFLFISFVLFHRFFFSKKAAPIIYFFRFFHSIFQIVWIKFLCVAAMLFNSHHYFTTLLNFSQLTLTRNSWANKQLKLVDTSIVNINIIRVETAFQYEYKEK